MASFREIQEAIDAGTMDGLRDIARVVQDEASRIIEEEAIDEGDLLHSDELDEDPDAFQIVVKWTAEHAIYVNDGSRPHWPPEDPIREWVKRNIRIQVTDTGDREPVFKPQLREGTKSPRQQEIDAITFLVQRKIAREGTDPVMFAERGAQKARQADPSRMIADAISNRLRQL